MGKELIKTAAKTYALFAGVMVAFQLALTLGAPWGVLTQGGFNVGTLPTSGRVLAGFSALLLIAMTYVVLAHAGLMQAYGLAARKWPIYLIAAIAALSLVANIMTPSAPERMMGAPIATILLISVIIVIVKNRHFSTSED